MLPSSLRANRLAACSVFLNRYELVRYTGTPRDRVASGTWPACRARVSKRYALELIEGPFVFKREAHRRSVLPRPRTSPWECRGGPATLQEKSSLNETLIRNTSVAEPARSFCAVRC